MAVTACEDRGYMRGLQLLKQYGGELTKFSRPLWSLILENQESTWWREHLEEQEIILLISDADIWQPDSEGKNLLMAAVVMDLAMVVRYCVSNATFENLHATDNNGNTAFTLACLEHRKSNHRETYSGSPVSEKNDLPMLRYLEEILKSEAAFSKERQSVKDNHTDIDAEIYANGKSLLQLACSRKEDMADLVGLLVKKGASLNVCDARWIYTTDGLCQERPLELSVCSSATVELIQTLPIVASPMSVLTQTVKKSPILLSPRETLHC